MHVIKNALRGIFYYWIFYYFLLHLHCDGMPDDLMLIEVKVQDKFNSIWVASVLKKTRYLLQKI